MLYEIRVYTASEGKAEAMRQRFLTEVVPRMPRHGIELVGVFTAPEEDGRLTYLTRFADEAARAAGWASFGGDAEWKAVKAATEVDGPLLAAQSVSVLTPAAAGLLLG
ncbi:NIPSNAP family protein [Aquabacter sp. L1I39]|uniref:NIPSNAP family protein n=1 Tax=Aquabacter sp. L1I39 TaxID=2820278 RepID=UPI001ADD4DCF|nr:NIPSNAP family protein [Aquabacter sp. L1I39]QTL02196.1 NIPSNAP family protein [Aquabacter sp. L1I39]